MTPPTPSFRARLATFWLRALFFVAGRAPWAMRLFRPLVANGVPLVSRKVRQNTRLNGMRIAKNGSFGFSRDVVGAFFDFIAEVAASLQRSPQDLRQQVIAVEGEEAFLKTRQSGRGAVMVTAHMGSFEVGLAALAGVEKKIRVVFKRDALDGFEKLRRPLRERLGVTECAIDEGWSTLIGLRDALAANEVVVMQADRAMAGQKAQVVPFLGGTLRIPVGPVTLAQINGSPIVPVFAIRDRLGVHRVFIEPAIDPMSADAVQQVGRVIEKFVARYPTQWLVLDAAFVEDAERGIK